MKDRSPSRVRIVLIALGLLSLPVLVAHVGVSAIQVELQRLGPEALLVLVPYVLGTALAALPWAWLLERRVRLSTGSTISSRFAASAANSLLPFCGVAGEACRLLWVPSTARTSGAAALIVDRLVYNFSGGLFLMVGAAAALATPLPASSSIAATVVGLLMLAGTIVVLLALSRWGLGHRLQRLVQRFSRKPGGTLGADLDAALRELWRGPKRRMLRALAVHFAARVVLGLEVFVALWSLNAPTRAADVVVFATVPIVTSLVASSIPSQVGVQEGAQALVSSALGFDPALGFSLVLLQRLRQLAVAPLAPVLMASARARSAAAEATAE